MHRFLSAVYKDFLILIRDKAGLAVIFVMPMALVLIMTLLQDSAYRSINESGIPIVFIDEDNDSLGIGLGRGLELSGFFEISREIDGKKATRDNAWKAVSKGKFMIGIVIPKGTTKAIREGVIDLVSQTIAEAGVTDVDSLSDNLTKKVKDSIQIEIFIDPVTKKSHVMTVTTSLQKQLRESAHHCPGCLPVLPRQTTRNGTRRLKRHAPVTLRPSPSSVMQTLARTLFAKSS